MADSEAGDHGEQVASGLARAVDPHSLLRLAPRAPHNLQAGDCRGALCQQ